MNWYRKCLLYAPVTSGILLSGNILASNVATQTVVFSIDSISEIAFSSDPYILNASQAIPGCNPKDVIDTTSFYAITSNGCSEKIVACLNSPMPMGTALFVWLTAANGATSQGGVYLDSSNQNLVTGISRVAQGNLPVSYLFKSSTSAGILPPTARIVTYTLTP